MGLVLRKQINKIMTCPKKQKKTEKSQKKTKKIKNCQRREKTKPKTKLKEFSNTACQSRLNSNINTTPPKKQK